MQENRHMPVILLIYFFYLSFFPSPFSRPYPCITTHLASIDSVIILVRISAPTFGFMRDSFLCMVHALLAATPEYAKANHELMLLDTGQMSSRGHVTILHLYRCLNPKAFSQLFVQQWHQWSLKDRLFGGRWSNCFPVKAALRNSSVKEMTTVANLSFTDNFRKD